MTFFSRLSSKSKDRRAASKAGPIRAAPKEDLLPLQLPSFSLLTDASLANPFLLSTPTRDRCGEDSDLRSLRSAETSPWVNVGETPMTPRMLDVKRKRAKVPELVDPVREKKEKIRLEKARLGVAEMTLLMDECGFVIKQRGLTTLGLFRPFRAAESLAAQRKLCLLFLDYMAEFDAPASANSIRGSEASKAVLLHAFKEELRYANGLRHFSGTPSFSGSPTPSADWYTSFLRRSSSVTHSHPPHSFSAFLLPSLPPASQALLLSTLTLLQAVVANAQHNAMTARRLCRSVGIYLFGMSPPAGSSSFDDLYNAWREAGDALEGCLKAFLREQTDLPPRLQELVDDYAAWVAAKMSGSNEGGRKAKVVKIEVESKGEWSQVGESDVNDQETGFVANGRIAQGSVGKPARRRPVEILLAAIEADPLAGDVKADEAAQLWSRIVERAKKGREESGTIAVLDDEVVRVLEMLGLDQPATAGDSDPFIANDSLRPRVRSLISDRRSSSLGNFSNFSTGNLLTPSPSQRTITPTWNDFKQTGFTTELDTASEFGLYNPETDGLFTKPAWLPRKVVEPEHRILGISSCGVDEEFPDVWMDTLGESTSTLAPVAGWPSLVVAPLQASVLSQDGSSRTIDHLVIYEKLLPPASKNAPFAPRPSLPSTASQTGVHRALSTASILGRRGGKSDGLPSSATDSESTLSPGRRWRRRASAIFATGSSEVDKPKHEPSAEPNSNLNLPSSLSTLLPSARRNRRSFVAADLPPPLPAISTAAQPTDPSEKRPTSPTSPSSIVRSFSRNLVKKRSRSSLYSLSRQRSPISEEGEPVPVPPLPSQFTEAANEPAESSITAEPETEGYRIESPPASPVAHAGEGLTESMQPSASVELAKPVDGEAELEGTADGTADRVKEETEEPREDVYQPAYEESAEKMHNRALEGLPVLGAPIVTVELADLAAERPAREERKETEHVVESQASAADASAGLPQAAPDEPPSSSDVQGTAASHAGDANLAPEEPHSGGEQPQVLPPTEAAQNHRGTEPALEQPVSEAERQSERATPASPIVTLSPPPEDAVEPTQAARAVGVPSTDAPLGLGLANAPVQAVEPESSRQADASPATPSKSLNAQLSSPSAATGTSPSTTPNSALSPVSPSLTNSPTPSTSSTASRKFLSNVGGFLRRNKSTSEKEQARRDKEEAKREKEEKKALRQLREEELRKEKRERKNPTPVSNVKARVKEIEEEQAAVSGSAPTIPTTPTRARTSSGIARPLSMVSPRSVGGASPVVTASPVPASHTPASQTLAEPASASPSTPVPSPANLFAAPLSPSPSTAADKPSAEAARGADEVSVDAPDATVDDVFAASPRKAAYDDAPAASDIQQTENSDVSTPPAIQVDAAPEESAHGPSTADEEASGALGAAPHEPTEEDTLAFDHETPVAVPQQELEHLHVKVPSSFADLPSPIPSPTPFSATASDQCPLAEDLTEKLPESHPPVFEPVPPTPVPTANQVVEAEQLSASKSAPFERATGDVDTRPPAKAADHDSVSLGHQDELAASSGIDLDARLATPIEQHAGAPVDSGAEITASPVDDPSATPTKPIAALLPPHVVHNSPLQQSLATTTSFETANSAAPSTARASLDKVRLPVADS
ncbi:hypothetical protein JCM10295v2_006360 [Rhodotorula toruloides]